MLDEPKRDRVSERHEATRQEIVAAAWELCRPTGLGGLSLRDLAKAVRMQPPSLYSYFGSKNAIYDAMFAEGARAYDVREAALELTNEPLSDLKAMMRFFVGFCTDDVERYQLLFQRTIPGFEPSEESFAISTAGLQRMQTRFAAIGLADPHALDLLTALGTGLADQQISNDPGGDRWIRLIDEAMEMFYNHLQRKT